MTDQWKPKGIRIIAKTKNGERAMQQALDDDRKEKWLQRKQYQTFYHQVIESTEPLTIRMEHRSRRLEQFIPPTSIAVPIRLALKENGVKEGKDYSLVLDA